MPAEAPIFVVLYACAQNKNQQIKDHPHPQWKRFIWHKRGGSVCYIFGVRMPYFQKSLDFNRLLCHTDPHCMAYFWGIFFANMGGGGGQNYFQKNQDNFPKADHLAKRDGILTKSLWICNPPPSEYVMPWGCLWNSARAWLSNMLCNWSS